MGKKVISISLYGKNPVYTLGAIANARHANRAYPGWVCRFYIADDVPEGVIPRLKDYGAEVIKMGPRLGHESMYWRFFAMVDPEVDIALSRDADSRFTKCELLVVNEWLASGKKFHVMNHSRYPFPIMGGLWGVRGGIPNFKELLESHLRAGPKTRGMDELFLRDNLYPQMNGKVFIHAKDPLAERRYFIEESVHPFPPIVRDRQGEFLGKSILPVGLSLTPRRTFMAFSIYKRTIFSQFLLTLWLGTMEKTSLFLWWRNMNIRFYVADNIKPDLIERLRRYGRVILKPAKTVRKDDPQYWKLLILSEKNLGAAVIVDFWPIFFLARANMARAKQKERRITFYELPPLEQGLPTGPRHWLRNVSTLSICGPAPPVSDIEDLVARRDPNENYREFVRSTVYPRTSTTRMVSVFRVRKKIGCINGLARIFVPSWLYEFAGYLKRRVF